MRTTVLSLRELLQVLVLFVVGLLIVGEATAQPGTWRAYPSLQSIKALDASSTSIWAATTGGLFSYEESTGEITTYTPVEGLFGVDINALVVDERRNAVWVGYVGGVIDRLDIETGDVQSFYDIARATQFIDRTVNELRVFGDSLYASTAFGVVVFDPERGEVRDTYSKFSTLDPATPVHDVLLAPRPDGTDGIWVATDEGVVHASLNNPNLQQASSWELETDGPTEVTNLAFYDGEVYACSSDTFRKRPDGTWVQVFFTNRPFVELVADEERVFGLSVFSLHRRQTGIGGTVFQIEGYNQYTAVTLSADGTVWVGDATGGLFRLPELGTETGNQVIMPAQTVIPTGPLLNQIGGLDVSDDGVLWVAHQRQQGAFTGISRLDEGEWATYSGRSGSIDVATSGYRSAFVGPDGSFYAGSGGDGLTVIRPDETVVTYRVENSTLRAKPGSPNPDFVVIGDVVADADGRVWVTNVDAENPLHILDQDGTWTALPYPPGVSSTVSFGGLVIDSFNQKWITGLSSTTSGGRGLVGFSTGTDPFSPSDDQAIHIDNVGTAGTGLPNAEVKALAFDGEDRLWLGTARGLATIFSVGSAFGGNPSLVQPQWARTADGTSFLLRDLDIHDIAVDPAQQIWIGSSTGAWLLNAEGDEVLQHLSQENSPLFSDNILDIAVDGQTGRIYFATDFGLLSLDGEATAAVPSVQDLDVAPSPFRPDQHPRGVLISGLVEETDIRILTLDGQVVASLTGRGGSIRWDGRDDRTGELVSSGIYVIAAVAANGQGTAHGKIAVIR